MHRPRPFLFLTLAILVGHPAWGLDLLQAYDLAQRSDPTLLQAAAERDAVRELRPQNLAHLLPDVRAQGAARDVNHNSKSSFIPGQSGIVDSFWLLNIDLIMQQPIYHHEHWTRLAQADARVAEAEARYVQAEQELVARTVRAYLGVLQGEDHLRFATAEKDTIARQTEQAHARFDVGLAAITDVHEAKAAFDQAIASEVEAIHALDDAREALSEITGTPSGGAVAPLAETMALTPPQPTQAEAWSEQALAGNPGVLAATYAVDAARREIDSQRAGHYPTLDLVSQFQATDSSRDRLNADGSYSKLGPRAESTSVGLELKIPLFQGGAIQSKVREAGFRLEAAQQALDRQRRATARSARDACRGVVAGVERVRALRSAVTAAQSALDAAEAGLDVGTRTMIDVLVEQKNLTRARRDLAQARYDVLNEGFALKRAVGALGRDDVEHANRWMTRSPPAP